MAALCKLRNNNGIDVSDKEIRRQFPAIFNTRRSTRVSEDYQFYRSEEVIDLMQTSGLRLVEIGQERMGWSQKRQPHTQIHVMRFMSPDIALRDFGVGDSRPEVVVMNSHDGRSTFKAWAGVFRLVCSNGMVVADADFGKVVRRHYGEANTFEKVREIISELPEKVAAISARIADWSSLQLTDKQQEELALQMLDIRLPSGSRRPEWLEASQVLEARRPFEAIRDGRRDLWTTFNVLQENLTNSTIDRIGGEGRRRAIQPITSVVDNNGYNQRLWATADAYFGATVDGLNKKERAAFEAVRSDAAKKAAKPIRRALPAPVAA